MDNTRKIRANIHVDSPLSTPKSTSNQFHTPMSNNNEKDLILKLRTATRAYKLLNEQKVFYEKLLKSIYPEANFNEAVKTREIIDNIAFQLQQGVVVGIDSLQTMQNAKSINLESQEKKYETLINEINEEKKKNKEILKVLNERETAHLKTLAEMRNLANIMDLSVSNDAFDIQLFVDRIEEYKTKNKELVSSLEQKHNELNSFEELKNVNEALNLNLAALKSKMKRMNDELNLAKKNNADLTSYLEKSNATLALERENNAVLQKKINENCEFMDKTKIVVDEDQTVWKFDSGSKRIIKDVPFDFDIFSHQNMSLIEDSIFVPLSKYCNVLSDLQLKRKEIEEGNIEISKNSSQSFQLKEEIQSKMNQVEEITQKFELMKQKNIDLNKEFLLLKTVNENLKNNNININKQLKQKTDELYSLKKSHSDNDNIKENKSSVDVDEVNHNILFMENKQLKAHVANIQQIMISFLLTEKQNQNSMIDVVCDMLDLEPEKKIMLRQKYRKRRFKLL
eukprot:TRINITY_DN809_c0_g1_i1.p1 TRINITY_DN809_c0_g1~~TRINITY_DN809_c0_g1_i1.p1  ORF type:complete len:510 (+),score=160.44 TRINITY_DN809_c0_g1_i1:56-1585(+)